MELIKVAETVLLQLKHFWVLQELDEAVHIGDKRAIGLLDDIYRNRSVSGNQLVPFMRITTALTSLLLPLSFAARFSDDKLRTFGFNIKDTYAIKLYSDSELVADPSPHKVLRTLRNAVAHLADFAAGNESESLNISFTPGILSCKSQKDMLVFHSEEGFVLLLSDLIKATRVAARTLLRN